MRRKNLHRFATDYLGIKLHLYQILILYLIDISRFIRHRKFKKDIS